MENNAWHDTGQCILWKSNGAFCVSDVTPGIGYPNILQGTFSGQGPTTNWNNFAPLQVSALQSWPVSWTINTPSLSGTWNSLIEFWMFTTNPGTGTVSMQPNGTELMIMPSVSSTYKPGVMFLTGNASIGGISWDVWAYRWTNDNTVFWNYIAYTPTNGNIPTLNMDVAPFFADAQQQTGHGHLQSDPKGRQMLGRNEGKQPVSR